MNRFMCTKETVYKISSLFDNIVKDEEILQEIIRGNNVEILKDYINGVYLKHRNGKKLLSTDVLGNMGAVGIYSSEKVIAELSMFKDLILNKAYFYNQEDIMRASDYGGIVGDKKDYVSTEIVYEPTSVYPFSNICEVRDEYVGIVPNRYKKINLPSEFSKITSNEEYIKFFKGVIDKSYSVNSLHEDRGEVYCRNRSVGYTSLDKLSGVESDFYNDLLELVVGLGKPVKRVYFYSDLKWSCILYRPCKDEEGEYEIVIK